MKLPGGTPRVPPARMPVPGVRNPETDRREFARYRRRPDLARVYVARQRPILATEPVPEPVPVQITYTDTFVSEATLTSFTFPRPPALDPTDLVVVLTAASSPGRTCYMGWDGGLSLLSTGATNSGQRVHMGLFELRADAMSAGDLNMSLSGDAPYGCAALFVLRGTTYQIASNRYWWGTHGATYGTSRYMSDINDDVDFATCPAITPWQDALALYVGQRMGVNGAVVGGPPNTELVVAASFSRGGVAVYQQPVGNTSYVPADTEVSGQIDFTPVPGGDCRLRGATMLAMEA